MNYRSVIVFGQATLVDDANEKLEAPSVYGTCDARSLGGSASAESTRAGWNTGFGTALTEASAKMRSGAPVDDEADYELPVWAGDAPIDDL